MPVLVRVPAGDSYQEMIRLVYQHNDIVDVSIHSLYKISKYRRVIVVKHHDCLFLVQVLGID